MIEKHRWKIEKDYADGMKLQVRLTSTFFVNGRMLEEIGYKPIRAAIEAELIGKWKT